MAQSSKPAGKPAAKTGKSSAPEFTSAQREAVQRIKRCKDYYDMLGVSKNASNGEIRKAYKKLALKLHPDKNKAPGAEQAFKAMVNAVAVLTDREKRIQYDRLGSSEGRMQRQQSRYNFHYSRFDETEVSFEELLNMYFQQTAASQTHNKRDQDQCGHSMLVLSMSILFAVILSMLFNIFISDPMYSLQPSIEYHIVRKTHNLGLEYYVKETFHGDYLGAVGDLEVSVEEEYISNMRESCFLEENYGTCAKLVYILIYAAFRKLHPFLIYGALIFLVIKLLFARHLIH